LLLDSRAQEKIVGVQREDYGATKFSQEAKRLVQAADKTNY